MALNRSDDCEIIEDYETKVEPEVKEKYSSIVKRRLLNLCKEMTNKVGAENFDKIFKQLDESGAVVTNVNQIIQTFKQSLHRNICDNFKDMWNEQEVDLQLDLLNFCKEKCKHNTTSWRPTGKTPGQQTKYIRNHYLKKKIAYIECALQAQIQSFNSICREVEAKRSVIEELNTRRDAVSQQMDIRMAQINKIDGELQSLQRDMCG